MLSHCPLIFSIGVLAVVFEYLVYLMVSSGSEKATSIILDYGWIDPSQKECVAGTLTTGIILSIVGVSLAPVIALGYISIRSFVCHRSKMMGL